MSKIRSEDFWKHRAWCESAIFCNHKFEKCPYNKNNADTYFQAPCCGRYVRFLCKHNTCTKCVKVHARQAMRDLKDNKDAGLMPHGVPNLEAQMWTVEHKLSPAQFDMIMASIERLPQHLGSAVDSIQTHLVQILTPLGDTMVTFALKTTLALALIYRISDDVFAVVLALAQYLMSVNVAFDVVQTFKDYCLTFFNKITAQTYGCEEIFNVVGFFLSVLTLGKGPNLSSMVQFYKNVCSVRFFSGTITSVYDTIKRAIMAAIDFVSTTFLGYSTEWLTDEPYNFVIDWCDAVDELHARSTKQNWDDDMLYDLDELSVRMTNVQQHWRSSKPPSTVLGLFQTHATVVRKMLDEVAAQGTRQLPRIEPTFIMLQGGTKYGKSLITPLLSCELARRCFDVKSDKSYSHYVYNRTVETEFWDGYFGQKIIVYDDFLQVYDSATKPNLEIMEIMRIGNSAPYFPHMARVEAKGRTRMAAEFVLMSSNKEPHQAMVQSIVEPEALLRRIDLMAKVRVKDEFLTSKKSVDYVKLDEAHESGRCRCSGVGLSDICLSHYLFDLMKWSEGEWLVYKTNLTFEQFVDDLVQRHLSRVTKSRDRINHINSVLHKNVTSTDKYECQSGDVPFVTSYDATTLREQLDECRRSLSVSDFYKFLIRMCVHVGSYLTQYWQDDDEVDLKAFYNEMRQESDFLLGCPASIRKYEYNHIDDLDSLLPTEPAAMWMADWRCMKAVRWLGPIRSYMWLSKFILICIKYLEEENIPYDNHVCDSCTCCTLAGFSYHSVDELCEYARILVSKYLNSGLEAQVGDDIISKVIDGDVQATSVLQEWADSLPTCSGTDIWKDLVVHVKSGTWNMTLLNAIAEENGVPLPVLQRESPTLTKVQMFKKLVQEKYAKLKEKPFFFLMSVVGVAATAGIFLGFFQRLFSKNEDESKTSLGDIIRVRHVGGAVKSSYVKQPGLEVDDTPTEMYIRLDKTKFSPESINTTDAGYFKRDARRQSYASSRPKTPSSYADSSTSGYHLRTYEAHSSEDPTLEDIEKITIKNMVTICSKDAEGKLKHLGHGIIVCGRILLTFAHLWCTDVSKFTLRKLLTKNDFEFDRSEVNVVRLMSGELEVDAMLIELPKRFPLGKNIVNHFASCHHTNEKYFSVRLLSTRNLLAHGLVRLSKGTARASDRPLSYTLNKDGTQTIFVVRQHYAHDIDTSKGDCGALMVQANTHKIGKILGIHVAGSVVADGTPGLACAISFEMLTEALLQCNGMNQCAPKIDINGVCVDETALNAQLDGFDIVGVVDKGVSDALGSNILESPFYECFGPAVTRPAVLNGTVDGVDVKVIAARKNLPVDTVPLDKKFLECAVREALITVNARPLKGVQKRVLSIEEATFGVEGDPFIESLNTNSSCGYPWVLVAKKRGKKEFIDLLRKTIDERVERACVERVDAAKRGERTTTIFTDHLKDERRKIDNFKFLKPRLFSGGPIDYTIVFKQYFGSYVSFIMHNRIGNTIGVGINVHGIEWTHLASSMLEKGDHVLAGDFSNYDGTLNAEILWKVLELIQAWYKGTVEEECVREVLWCEIVNSMHLFRNTLYQFDHGNPSGNPMTTIVNSLYQLIAWYYVVQVQGYNLIDFIQRTCLITYGDDNVMSVREAYLDPKLLVEGFAKIGMTLTSERKDEEFGYATLGDIQFLKRKFSYENKVGRFLAPLPKDVLREMVYWYKRPNHWNEVGPDILECCMRECAHHDDAFFEDMRKTLLANIVDSNLEVPRFRSIGEYRVKMLEPDYIYCQLM